MLKLNVAEISGHIQHGQNCSQYCCGKYMSVLYSVTSPSRPPRGASAVFEKAKYGNDVLRNAIPLNGA